jgi:hypothetical protein
VAATIFLETFGQAYAKINVGEWVLAFAPSDKRVADRRVGHAQIVIGAGVVEISSIDMGGQREEAGE